MDFHAQVQIFFFSLLGGSSRLRGNFVFGWVGLGLQNDFVTVLCDFFLQEESEPPDSIKIGACVCLSVSLSLSELIFQTA